MSRDNVVDIGTAAVPEAEVIEIGWQFQASTAVHKVIAVESGAVSFSMVLDLGFDLFHRAPVVLRGVRVAEGCGHLVEPFVESWCANGQPNPLRVETEKTGLGFWAVTVERVAIEIGTLRAIGFESLADALVEQGIGVRV